MTDKQIKAIETAIAENYQRILEECGRDIKDSGILEAEVHDAATYMNFKRLKSDDLEELLFNIKDEADIVIEMEKERIRRKNAGIEE